MITAVGVAMANSPEKYPDSTQSMTVGHPMLMKLEFSFPRELFPSAEAACRIIFSES